MTQARHADAERRGAAPAVTAESTGGTDHARKPKVLFVGEALTLAHMVRVLALAEALRDRGYDTELAADPRYRAMVGEMRVPFHPIHSMSPERFQQAITSGSPIFDEPTLAAYVEEDLALIRAIRPDVVVGDFRISLGISARVANVPYICLTNAYWSPYARVRRLVPEFRWLRFTGNALGQFLFDLGYRVGQAVHVAPVNRIRRRYGLEPLPKDFRYALCDGDLTAYADVPELIPTVSLPDSHVFIGPVAWAPRPVQPEWWDDVVGRGDSTDLAYVTLGSSGPPALLESVFAALARAGMRAIVSTAGRADPKAGSGIHCAPFIAGDLACRAAAVIVSNGGSPTTYQGLAEGKPVLGLPTNMDQFLNMGAVADANCGILVRSGSATPSSLEAALRAMRSLAPMRERARQVGASIAALDTVAMFRDLVHRAVHA